VNFNYTSLLSKVIQTIPQNIVCKRKHNGNERIDKIGKVIHVHGYCDNLPIIGVNDTTQIANKELAKDLRFVRYIVKPTINQYLRQGYDRDATALINNSTIICIYGMSLGATDKKWWDMLIQWLSASSERQLVLFDYDDKYSSATPYGWLEKEDFILDKFDQYNSNKNLTAESLRSRIHIAVHKNIFQINLNNNQKDKQKSNRGRISGNIFATESIINNAVQINNSLISNDNYSKELETAQKVAEGIPLLIK